MALSSVSVVTNSLLLVLAGMVYNSLSGHPYPHRVAQGAMPDVGQGVRVSEQDLRAALGEYGEVLDVALNEGAGGVWTYRFTVLTRQGEYCDVTVDARRNKLMQVTYR